MKFSLRFTKILVTSILVVLVGSIALPAGVAFAQVSTEIPKPVNADTDPYFPFKDLFDNVGVATDGKTYGTGINDIRPLANPAFGVNSLRIESILALSVVKNTTPGKDEFNDLYVDMTASTSTNNDGAYTDGFITRITYEDANGKPQEKIVPIPYDNKGKRKTGENKTFYMKTDKNTALWTLQNVTTDVTDLPAPIPYGKKADVTLWYCAGVKTEKPGYKTFIGTVYEKPGTIAGVNQKYPEYQVPKTAVDNTTIMVFKDSTGKDMCGGTAYIRIGTGKSVTYANATEAADTGAAITDKTSTEGVGVLPSCGLIFGGGTFMGCIALIIYHLLFRLAAFFAYLTGNIFDFFLGYSISSSAYSSSFITSGWETVRDIANIFFICLLIYVAISTVFGKPGNKKLVGTIVINAILINFSLLITRGAIDLSNITARVFYSQIHVENKGVVANTAVPGGNAADVDYVGDSGYKSVSTIMLQTFDPQIVFQRALTQQPIPSAGKDTDTTANSNVSFGAQRSDLNEIKNTSPEDYAGYFALVSLICAFIAFTVGMIFWSIGFIFIGRVVGLYISMIFSPFAFMSRDIPFLKMLDKWHFDGWMKELTSYMLSAPITVVYFYIVIRIMQSDMYASKIFANGINATSFVGTVLWICIPLIIIYGLLSKGKDMILGFSGEAGKMIQGYMNGVGKTLGGLALGAATGGTALALSKTVGKAASNADEGGVGRFARNLQTSKYFGWAGRGISDTLKKGKEGSFDIRNTDSGKSMSKFFGGADMNKFIKTDSTKGGYKGGVERDAEKKIKNAEYLKSQARTDEQKKTEMDDYNKRKNDAYEKSTDKTEDEAKAAEYTTKKTAYDDSVARKTAQDAAMEASMGRGHVDPAAYVQQMKDNGTFEAEKAAHMAQRGITAEVLADEPGVAPKSRAHVNVETIDELDAARRTDYVQSLKDGQKLSGLLQTVFGSMGPAAVAAMLPFVGGLAAAAVGAGVGAITSGGIKDMLSSKDSEANQKAIKKLEEMGKASQKLDEVKQAISEGLKELIAIEKSHDPAFLRLSQADQNTQIADALNALKDDKKKYAEKIEIVEAMKKYEYNIKDLQAKVKTQRDNMKTARDNGDNAALLTAAQALEGAIKELSKANKHQQVWNDVGKFRKEQQDKQKAEEKK